MTSRSTALCLAMWAVIGWSGIGAEAAVAADLGGSCCVDLEERVAELEATTVRKGNRKASLTVSGWINEGVFFWDDGVERNAYVGTNSLEQSRVRFVGEGKIQDGWSAGYILELGINGTGSNTFSQDGPGAGPTISNRKSSWFLKSSSYGKITVGYDGTATYHLLNDADATSTRNVSDAEAAAVSLAQFRVRSNGAFVNSLQWRDFLQGMNNDTPGQDGRRNIVRYDSPELLGFTLTAMWGEDDLAGVALTYKYETEMFRVLGRTGYERSTDETTGPCSAAASLDCDWFGFAGTVMHKSSGLFVYAGYGQQTDDSEARLNAAAEQTDKTIFVQSGIEKKWLPLGKTTLFVEWRQDNAGSNLGKSFGGANIQSSDIELLAAGAVQAVEAADLNLYAVYRHVEGNSTNFNGDRLDLDDFDLLITGARILF